MDVDRVIEDLRAAAVPANAAPMRDYMKGIAPFLGVKKPDRARVTKGFLAAARRDPPPPDEVLAAMHRLFALDEREFHYLAIDLLGVTIRGFPADTVHREVMAFIDTSPWWDSVDALRGPLSLWAKAEPGRLTPMIDQTLAGSMWQRRVAITLQLLWKTDTDTAQLTRAIAENLDDKEFFIQKAIGWALRDYAKTDPQWVRRFVDEYQVTGLARREATKHLR
jgi:3-methyladenine DNA glycosylase AlkD